MDMSKETAECVELADQPGCFREDIMSGLSRQQKFLTPRCFYDRRGSELFEAITRLPEYYLTRAELEILYRRSREITALVGQGCILVELGSGSSRKTRYLLEALKPTAYVPIDISDDHLRQASGKLKTDYPWLDVRPICGDFCREWALPVDPGGQPILIYYSGSSIGNFTPRDAGLFLRRMKNIIGCNGAMLVGIDTKKDHDLLHRAYNDSHGITAEFNKNLLQRINRELNADFDLSYFDHLAEYDVHSGCVRMFLISTRDQVVHVDDRVFEFFAGERIHTEDSYKYEPDEFRCLAQGAGFASRAVWCDDKAMFSMHYLTDADEKAI